VKIHSHRIGLSAARAVPSARRVSLIVRTVLASERAKFAGEVNVVFVDGKTIRRLNRTFLNENGDTDVIAFPYENGAGRASERAMGDIYISVPEATRNARRFREPVERELVRLIVHGLLHLLGYRDHNSKEKAEMWSKQESFVDRFSRPT
jgi:rRNA maturation RNase YbeY